MSARVPSNFLLVPGPWRRPGEVVEALKARGVDAHAAWDEPIAAGQVRVDVIEDERLGSGFARGRSGPLPSELVERVAACRRAALVEIGQTLDADPTRVAEVGRALRDAGGLAVRLEASGVASPWKPWLGLLSSGGASELCELSVCFVRDEDDAFFTCGMHGFDLPDAEIIAADAEIAIDWLDARSVYQLAEQPALASGHTFRPYAEAAPRVLERWPDHRHHPEDGRYNPFGVWRLLPEGVSRLEARAHVPTIVPPLVAMLTAAERSAKRALTREEVAALVSEASAIALEPRHIREMERSRGYADIEPELAWEQWQVVRETL